METTMTSKLIRAKQETRNSYDEDSFEEYLNDAYGDVEICGMTFESGRALKELDPIAFRCAMSDMDEETEVWICGICGEEFDEELQAIECCQSEFICYECDTIHDTVEEAEECCKDEND